MGESEYREAEQRLWESVGLAPSEERVRLPVTGTEIRVQVVGEGPPVLFVHGAPNAGSTWAPLLAHLEGFRCYLVDRPGAGLSDEFSLTPGSVEGVYEFARRFCPEVLDGLGLDRADLVVSSLGGFIGLVSAAGAPERFGRMVQMACPALVPGMKMPGLMRALSLRPVRRISEALPPSPRMAKQMLRQIGHGESIAAGRIPSGFVDWYVALQGHTSTMRNDGEMIGGFVSPRGVADGLTIPRELLGSIDTPTLFLWGADDTYGGAEIAEDVVAAMPNAELVMLPGAGHLPWLDDPAAIGERTAGFLRAAQPASA